MTMHSLDRRSVLRITAGAVSAMAAGSAGIGTALA
jgi:hypothetical protein